MKLIKTSGFRKQLLLTLRYIALDNPHAALSFERELNAKLSLVIDQPLMCRPSRFISQKRYRDLIHQGYTIIYKVEQDEIVLLDIFEWQNR